MKPLTAILSYLRELVLPRLCTLCECKLAPYERGVCLHCSARLARYDKTMHHADERLWSSPIFGNLYSLYAYRKGEAVQRLIHCLKYHSHLELAEMLADELLLCHPTLREQGYSLILATPTSSRNFRHRGYNQALVLARSLGKRLGIPASDRYLLRPDSSQSQSRLGKLDRLENIRGAFTLAPERASSLQGSRLLLVDDVLTTGATLTEQLQLLESAGVSLVDVATASVAV